MSVFNLSWVKYPQTGLARSQGNGMVNFIRNCRFSKMLLPVSSPAEMKESSRCSLCSQIIDTISLGLVRVHRCLGPKSVSRGGFNFHFPDECSGAPFYVLAGPPNIFFSEVCVSESFAHLRLFYYYGIVDVATIFRVTFISRSFYRECLLPVCGFPFRFLTFSFAVSFKSDRRASAKDCMPFARIHELFSCSCGHSIILAFLPLSPSCMCDDAHRHVCVFICISSHTRLYGCARVERHRKYNG